jgi:hypothetical protein
MSGLHTSPLIIVLLVSGVVFANYVTFRLDDDKDWAEINELYKLGYEQRKNSQIKASESTFREAAKKLEKYRSQYLKDRSGLRFLRATFRLGSLNELGDRDKEARKFYQECLNHPLVNSSTATADTRPILALVRERMAAVEGRLKPGSRAAEFPRIVTEGGSKGPAKNLPLQTSDLHP